MRAKAFRFRRGIISSASSSARRSSAGRKRNPEVGSMKRDGIDAWLGSGWGGVDRHARFAAAANVELRDDGTARVACGAQDIGTGTYTVLALLTSEKTGVPVEKVEVVLGDTDASARPGLGRFVGDCIGRSGRLCRGGQRDQFVVEGRDRQRRDRRSKIASRTTWRSKADESSSKPMDLAEAFRSPICSNAPTFVSSRAAADPKGFSAAKRSRSSRCTHTVVTLSK